MSKVFTIVFVIMSFCFFSSCGDDDYLNEMMLTNSTKFNWHEASINFMNSKNIVTKRKSIGTVERYDWVYVQKDDDYFFVEFTDDNGAKHQTEKYLTNTTVSVSTLAE